jgi:hypothetical protein
MSKSIPNTTDLLDRRTARALRQPLPIKMGDEEDDDLFFSFCHRQGRQAGRPAAEVRRRWRARGSHARLTSGYVLACCARKTYVRRRRRGGRSTRRDISIDSFCLCVDGARAESSIELGGLIGQARGRRFRLTRS